MLLSDKLIRIGRQANKKNNLSMADKSRVMFNNAIDSLEEAILKTGNYDIMAREAQQINSVFNYACECLREEGYSYFKNDLFLELADKHMESVANAIRHDLKKKTKKSG